MIQWLKAGGFEGKHTLDLPAGNRSQDGEVAAVADKEFAALITKDSDFVDSHLLRGRPQKLLLVSTGNISNNELQALMTPLIPTIVREFQACNFIELNRAGLILRG